MNVSKLAALAAVAAQLSAADFSIELDSPASSSNASFSIRTKDCAQAQFSGRALSESGSKQRSEDLMFVPGSVAGSYSVIKPNMGYAPWIAAITAECNSSKLGVLVPVGVNNQSDRAGAKFVGHAPTPLEMEEALRAVQAAARGK